MVRSVPADVLPADVTQYDQFLRCTYVWDGIIQHPIPSVAWWRDPIYQWQRVVDIQVDALEQAIVSGKLVGVSDGSYKDDVATAAFSLAVEGQAEILRQVKVRVPRTTEQLSAYRAELMGCLAMMAGIERIAGHGNISAGSASVGFDNLTGYRYVTGVYQCSPESSDFDLVHAILQAMQSSALSWNLFWVRGHQDATGNPLSQREILNVESDCLAKACWEETQNLEPLDPFRCFQSENFGLHLGSEKLFQFDSNRCYNWVYKQEIQEYWGNRHAVSAESWEQIDWDAVEGAMKSLPMEVRQWSSKHLAGFSATGRVMRRRDETQDVRCPICQAEEETEQHLWACSDARATQKWQELRSQVSDKLDRIRTAPDIKCLILQILPPL